MIDRRTCALVDDNILHRRARLQRFLDCRKELHFAAAAIGAVLGDHGGSLGIVNAIDKRVGGESAEDHRVRRADAGAGQHGDGQLRSHAHVDGDAIAFLYAQRLQHIGELLHFTMQLLIGQSANLRPARSPR